MLFVKIVSAAPARVEALHDSGLRHLDPWCGDLRPAHWWWLACIEAAGSGQFLMREARPRWIVGLLGLAFRAAALGLVAHGLWVVSVRASASLSVGGSANAGRATHRLASRDRLRAVLVAAFGICSALVLLAALLYVPSARRPAMVHAGEAFVFLLIATIAATLALQFDRRFLPAGPAIESASAAALAPALGPASPRVPASDRARARLESLMQQEIWREPGLTVATLAARANLPEYRVRQLIHQELGFRNFTAFVNAYRLAAAADRLADPRHARTPILTIALDLGWGSIGPLNRAFRAHIGVRPSDYRRARL